MTKRYYQLFALALLIGAPLIVSLLSNFIPGLHPLGPPAAQASVRPDYMQPAANPGANLPSAQPDPPSPAQIAQQQTSSGGSGPMLNPTGMSVAGINPSAAAATASSAAPAMSAEPTAGGMSADQDDGSSPAPADSEDGMIQRREHMGR